MIRHLNVDIPGQGLHEITDRLEAMVREAGVKEGLCTLFVQHTSASLLIDAGQDGPSQNDPLYTHQNEGPDDMPGHIKSALTATHLCIPVVGGRLALGTWQGVHLWEHRHQRGARRIVVHLGV
ncbi:MAG: YjbQ family protein [Sulfuricaulis sp.]|nr:YjbQ family protein [Sulfuricaulis sp.]